MRMSSTLGIAVLLALGCSRTPVPDAPVEGDDEPGFAAANEIIFRPARRDQTCLALSDDGRLIALGYVEGRVEVFSVTGEVVVGAAFARQVNACRFFPDSSAVLIAPWAEPLSLLKAAAGEVPAPLKCRAEWSITHAACMPGGGRLLLGGQEEALKAFVTCVSPASGAADWRFDLGPTHLRVMLPLGADEFITACFDGQVRRHSLRDGKCLRLRAFPKAEPHSGALSPCGKMVAVACGGEEGQVAVLDSRNLDTLGALPRGKSASGVFFSPDSAMLGVLWHVGGEKPETDLCLYKIPGLVLAGSCKCRVVELLGGGGHFASTPDGKRFAICNPKGVSTWTWQQLKEHALPGRP